MPNITTTGNTNEVKLVYSNNPVTKDTGTSKSDKVTDYVFGLDVTKTASRTTLSQTRCQV